jgi:hypothetical protein
VNLHQERYWWPDADASGDYVIFGRKLGVRGSVVQYYLWLQIMAGWLLSATFVPGMNGSIRSDLATESRVPSLFGNQTFRVFLNCANDVALTVRFVYGWLTVLPCHRRKKSPQQISVKWLSKTDLGMRSCSISACCNVG